MYSNGASVIIKLKNGQVDKDKEVVMSESMLDDILLEWYFKGSLGWRIVLWCVASASDHLGRWSPASSWCHTQLTVLYSVLYISLKYIIDGITLNKCWCSSSILFQTVAATQYYNYYNYIYLNLIEF